MLLFFWKAAGGGELTVPAGASEVLINGNAPTLYREYRVVAGASQVIINGNQPAVGTEFSRLAGASEVLIQGNQPTLSFEKAVAGGASEVLINGNAATISTGTVASTVRADTHGSGLYDRQLELQEEDDLILQVIQSFLKHAA